MKKCPYCSEDICEDAKKCRFCGEWLPQTKGDYILRKWKFFTYKELHTTKDELWVWYKNGLLEQTDQIWDPDIRTWQGANSYFSNENYSAVDDDPIEAEIIIENDCRLLPDKKADVVNPLCASDWLQNMIDVFGKRAAAVLENDRTSLDLLAYFTLLVTTKSAFNILHACPSSSPYIGQIYRDLRAYYECLWQLVLLGKYESDDNIGNIGKLYGLVAHRITMQMDDVFADNPNIKGMLRSAFDDLYPITFNQAVAVYIRGGHEKSMEQSGDLLLVNAKSCARNIAETVGLDSDGMPKIAAILHEDTDSSLHLRCLTDFDFPHCVAVYLPDKYFDPL